MSANNYISVVMYVSDTNKAMKSLDYLLKQTYKWFNVILITKEHIDVIDSRVEIKKHDGDSKILAYMNAVISAKGNYVVFLDEGDYLSVDYLRIVMKFALENNADFIFSDIVFCDEKSMKLASAYANSQTKLNFSKELEHNVDNLNIHLKKLSNKVLQTSSLLKEFEKIKLGKISLDTLSEADVNLCLFSFLENICYCVGGIYYTNKCSYDIIEKINYELFNNESFTADYKKRLDELSLVKHETNLIEFDNTLEQIKNEISSKKYKYISFDIFDTCVTRPFYKPTDLFYLLDGKLKNLLNTNLSFHEIRINAELGARHLQKKVDRNKQDITISQIYDYMVDVYDLDSIVAKKMLEYEKELEISYCKTRKTTLELFEMLKYIDVKIILTSDMYLDKDTLDKILNKNGFSGYENIFVSSEYGKLKATGDLFKKVVEYLKVDFSDILHIGDNYNSDVEEPKKLGIRAIYLPKTIDLFESFSKSINIDIIKSTYTEEYLGYATVQAVFANRYFDNPFKFNKLDLKFFCGYFMSKIIIAKNHSIFKEYNKEKSYDKILFISEVNNFIEAGYQKFYKHNQHLPKPQNIKLDKADLICTTLDNIINVLNLPIEYNEYNTAEIYEIFKYILNSNDLSNQNENYKEKSIYFDNLHDFNQFLFKLFRNNFSTDKFKDHLIKINSNIFENLKDTYISYSFVDKFTSGILTKNKKYEYDLIVNEYNQSGYMSNKLLEGLFQSSDETVNIELETLTIVEEYYNIFNKIDNEFSLKETIVIDELLSYLMKIDLDSMNLFENIKVKDHLLENKESMGFTDLLRFVQLNEKLNLNGKEVILFGSGKIFNEFILKNKKLLVKKVLDNNIDKIGRNYIEYEVIHPSCVDNWEKYFIIITVGNYIPIENQLKELGLIKYKNFINYLEFGIGK